MLLPPRVCQQMCRSPLAPQGTVEPISVDDQVCRWNSVYVDAPAAEGIKSKLGIHFRIYATIGRKPTSVGNSRDTIYPEMW